MPVAAELFDGRPGCDLLERPRLEMRIQRPGEIEAPWRWRPAASALRRQIALATGNAWVIV